MRPSCMAFCISGIVASTTEKGLLPAVGGGLGLQAAEHAATRRIAAREYFMLGIVTLFASKRKHLGVLHDDATACRANPYIKSA